MSTIKTKAVTMPLTRTEVARRLSSSTVTALEERALRMRYGLALEPDAALQFAHMPDERTQAAIAQLEHEVLSMLDRDPRFAQDKDTIAALKGLK